MSIIMSLIDENEWRLSLKIDGQYNMYGHLKEKLYYSLINQTAISICRSRVIRRRLILINNSHHHPSPLSPLIAYFNKGIQVQMDDCM